MHFVRGFTELKVYTSLFCTNCYILTIQQREIRVWHVCFHTQHIKSEFAVMLPRVLWGRKKNTVFPEPCDTLGMHRYQVEAKPATHLGMHDEWRELLYLTLTW